MRPPQPTPTERRIDPNTPRGARRNALMWFGFALVGVLAIGLAGGGWWVAQENDYQDNVRGWDAGDPFPWVPVVLAAAWIVVSLITGLVRWARYRRMLRQP